MYHPNTLQFRVTISCSWDDSFSPKPEPEIARILRDLAARVESGDEFDTCRNLYDRNGNNVGTAALKTVQEHNEGRRHMPDETSERRVNLRHKLV